MSLTPTPVTDRRRPKPPVEATADQDLVQCSVCASRMRMARSALTTVRCRTHPKKGGDRIGHVAGGVAVSEAPVRRRIALFSAVREISKPD